jgi:hypothetical protein
MSTTSRFASTHRVTMLMRRDAIRLYRVTMLMRRDAMRLYRVTMLMRRDAMRSHPDAMGFY